MKQKCDRYGMKVSHFILQGISVFGLLIVAVLSVSDSNFCSFACVQFLYFMQLTPS